MSDNGSQPISVSFMKTCRELEINQVFTSYNNPKGNADTERIFRTMKGELIWVGEWTSPFQFVDELSRRITDYNKNNLYTALNYQAPNKFE